MEYQNYIPAGGAEGEVQFTADGLSGICIFDLSRFMRKRPAQGSNAAIRIDLAPDMSEEEIRNFLASGGTAGLAGLLDTKIADLISAVITCEVSTLEGDRSEITGDGSGRSETVTSSSANLIVDETKAAHAANLIKNFTLGVKSTKGWKDAQTTSGGVPLSELNTATMESNLVPGIYFVGETTDYDGPSGGFNLDWAWVTGIKAGTAAAGKVLTLRASEEHIGVNHTNGEISNP
jgi:predicted flavoprotein YhiN